MYNNFDIHLLIYNKFKSFKFKYNINSASATTTNLSHEFTSLILDVKIV